jgi:hypothetical protein
MNDHDAGRTPADTAPESSGPESSGPEDPGAEDFRAEDSGPDSGSTGESDAAAVPTVYTDARDVTAIIELAEAERATVRRGASPAQAEGLRVVGDARRTEDRVSRWRSTRRPGDRGPR